MSFSCPVGGRRCIFSNSRVRDAPVTEEVGNITTSCAFVGICCVWESNSHFSIWMLFVAILSAIRITILTQSCELVSHQFASDLRPCKDSEKPDSMTTRPVGSFRSRARLERRVSLFGRAMILSVVCSCPHWPKLSLRYSHLHSSHKDKQAKTCVTGFESGRWH